MKTLKAILLVLTAAVLLVNGGLLIFANQPKKTLPVLGKVADFRLTDSNGKEFSLNHIRGKVFVVNFMFTSCAGVCPILSQAIQDIQRNLTAGEDVRFLSISVNPENDSPQVLSQYAKLYDADTQKWFFLTGPRATIQKIAVEQFKVGSVEEPVFHSANLILVDAQRRIRGYYAGTDPKALEKLLADIARLSKGWPGAAINFPLLNASLNACAFFFLLFGWMAIRNKNRKLHQKLMVCALIASVAFLVSYVTYHALVHGVTHYQKQGWIRLVYFTVLLTHTPLAVVIVPFCVRAVWFAYQGNFSRHVRITRWLLPVWMYVSVTGVVIYLMLYVF